jgi:hypothetical protein
LRRLGGDGCFRGGWRLVLPLELLLLEQLLQTLQESALILGLPRLVLGGILVTT